MTNELKDLVTTLDRARAALIATTEGLTDEQAGSRPTASVLCLGGLLKHVAAMEENWVNFTVEGPTAMKHDLPDGVTWQDLFTGRAAPPQWMIDHGNQFALQDGETLAGVVEHYRAVAARSTKILAGLTDLDVIHPLPSAPWFEAGATYTVRRAILHLIVEIAQHTGQADIIRESIDGRTAG